MRNKRGWMRILEATIAVMVVSGAMIAVYSNQTDREIGLSDYFYDLQKGVLSDIFSRSDLRLNVLDVVEEVPSDLNFDALNVFIDSEIPLFFSYSIRVCELGDPADVCNMNSDDYIASFGKDVFVEDIVISSELSGGGVYHPKKLRLFVWEEPRAAYVAYVPDPRDAYLVVDGFDVSEWDMMNASIAEGVLKLVDNGDTTMGIRSGAFYKGVADSYLDVGTVRPFFAVHFRYKRIEGSNEVLFYSLVEANGNPVLGVGNQMMIKDGIGASGEFAIDDSSGSDQLTGVSVAVGGEYDLRFTVNSEAGTSGDIMLDVDGDLDGHYDDGSIFGVSYAAAITDKGIIPRFDLFGDSGAVSEIFDLKIYAYPDVDMYSSLNAPYD